MSKIAIVTDSTAYIPNDICQELNISVVPLVVIWGDEIFVDGVTIQPNEFYTRLATAKVMPSTSQATVADMLKVYKNLLEQDYEIFGIFLSSKLSGTLQSAEQAREEIGSGKEKITLFDSATTAMALGFQAMTVARLAKDGASIKDCVAMAEKAKANTGIYFAVDTLEFLHRGGRIGGAQRLLGAALNLKPVLTIKDGKVEPVARVRTMSKTLEHITELVINECAGKSNVHLATLHANAEANAKLVLDQASKQLNAVESVLSSVSPVVGTHTGPGTVGLAFMAGI